jgi:hypothetical protein
MSRYFMVQSWVGSHENEPDYNGNQCGERNVRSSEVAPLYDQYGNANIKAFSDEALSAKKTPSKTKSAFQTVALADSHYDRLANLSEELDKELESGKLSFDDWSYARKTLDVRLEKAWSRLSKARGWTNDNNQCYPTGEEFTLDLEHSSQRQLDYSVIPSGSVFASLKDDNLFKKCAVFVLTACKWFANVTTTVKQLVKEGLV